MQICILYICFIFLNDASMKYDRFCMAYKNGFLTLLELNVRVLQQTKNPQHIYQIKLKTIPLYMLIRFCTQLKPLGSIEGALVELWLSGLNARSRTQEVPGSSFVNSYNKYKDNLSQLNM